jgi:beta-N-acetylhexosaminidase
VGIVDGMSRSVQALLACALLAGCSSSGSHEAVSDVAGPVPSATPDTTASPPPDRTPGAMPSIPGVTRAEQRRAEQAVGRMTLGQMAGQVVVASYAGTSAPVDLVTREHLAGVITFSENIASIDRLRSDLERLQGADRRPWPVFAGIDQEGGVVVRAGAPLTEFPALMTYGASGRRDLAEKAARASGEELRAVGFTVVFAPDADVTTGPADPTIGSRSAGSDPDAVAEVAGAAVRGYRAAGILPVVKHFPGHGSVPADSHAELPVQRASRATLWRRDLLPFRHAAKAGVPAMMVAHIDVHAVEPGVPSSVSRRVVAGVLRDRLDYHGLVVTDSMQMAGLAAHYRSGEAAVRALSAGVDLLLMPAKPVAAKRAIVAAVHEGRLPERRLSTAATRVVAHLIHVGGTDAPAPSTIGNHGMLSHRASAAAVTVVDGPCSGRLVGGSVAVRGDADAVGAFERAASGAGLGTGRGDSIALIGYGGRAASADVVVATDTPYVLAKGHAPVKIATYSSTPGAMRALVDVLLGRRRAPGTLPVEVPGVTRNGC